MSQRKLRILRWLQAIPGVGRLRALRPGTDAHVGVLVDAFAAFATLDDELSALEADLILDMLRSAFPELRTPLNGILGYAQILNRSKV